MDKELQEFRGTYETPVNFKMLCYYFYAWITRRNIVHKNILLLPKKDDN